VNRYHTFPARAGDSSQEDATMRTMTALILAGGLAAAAAADDKADPTAGTWVVESVTRDGKADDALKGASRVHDAGKYTLTPAGGKATTGTYTVDAGKSPVTIDMKPDAGRYKGKTLLGIVKTDGEHLTICFAEPGKDRPTAFEARDGWVLAVHKKAK